MISIPCETSGVPPSIIARWNNLTSTYLFEPGRVRNLKIIHVETKAAAGVDIVGDLTNPSFLAHLAELNVRSVRCCNLLEHVMDRTIICDAIMSILKPGGYIIATVPNKFPYHPDPIDTMYRPTVEELIALFPGTSVYKAAIVRASRFPYEMGGKYLALYRLVACVAVPFYRPRRWWANVQRLAEIVGGYMVTCVVLRKHSRQS